MAQLISSIIAAYGDWGFSQVQGVSYVEYQPSTSSRYLILIVFSRRGGWIGITWIWNIVWFFPLDFVKFGVRALVGMWNRRRAAKAGAQHPVEGVPMSRTQSRHESLYSNRTSVRSLCSPQPRRPHR